MLSVIKSALDIEQTAKEKNCKKKVQIKNYNEQLATEKV